jgi:hypothetical protein
MVTPSRTTAPSDATNSAVPNCGAGIRRLGKLVISSVVGVAIGIGASAIVPRIISSGQASMAAAAAASPEEAEAKLLAEFKAEETDPSWSVAASADVVEWFALVAKGSARVRLEGAECRTGACIATLQWPNLTAAKEEYQRFLAPTLRSIGKCRSEIYLPPTETKPYQALLILSACR